MHNATVITTGSANQQTNTLCIRLWIDIIFWGLENSYTAEFTLLVKWIPVYCHTSDLGIESSSDNTFAVVCLSSNFSSTAGSVPVKHIKLINTSYIHIKVLSCDRTLRNTIWLYSQCLKYARFNQIWQDKWIHNHSMSLHQYKSIEKGAGQSTCLPCLQSYQFIHIQNGPRIEQNYENL